MKKLMVLFLLVGFSASSFAAWRTCVPRKCSQIQETFESLSECEHYQAYRNREAKKVNSGDLWGACFRV